MKQDYYCLKLCLEVCWDRCLLLFSWYVNMTILVSMYPPVFFFSVAGHPRYIAHDASWNGIWCFNEIFSMWSFLLLIAPNRCKSSSRFDFSFYHLFLSTRFTCDFPSGIALGHEACFLKIVCKLSGLVHSDGRCRFSLIRFVLFD